ncbi:hypothetical protein D9M73_161570 [compost metagenome]
MLSWTSSRDPARQLCPDAAKIPDTTPLAAASRSASAKTILGDLPPSSRSHRASRAAAIWLTALPDSVPPVKLIRATLGSRTKASPTSFPNPVTTLITPGGKPASSNNRATSSAEAELCSDGLCTTVQPAASAGAILLAASISGEFQGVIAATTPTGSSRV